MALFKTSAVIFILACLFPAGWRLFFHGFAEPAGLVSDLCAGLLLASLSWQRTRLLRGILLGLWFLIHVVSLELLAVVGRMPSWQDLVFIADPQFLKNTTAGFHFVHPGFAVALAILTVSGSLLPLRRPDKRVLIALFVTGLLLWPLHGIITKAVGSQSIAARYNPVHWFISDAFKSSFPADNIAMNPEDLPPGMRTADISGTPFFVKGRARNVLLVVLEGVSGIYLPEIREHMKASDTAIRMENLAAGIKNAMLVPDMVAHSHQTIRGLYAIHCGDFSKFSFTLPKAVELQFQPDRAGQCLPAQLAANGWETHYLQGAPLQFMNKDMAMPLMGFQQVHGVEWFTEKTRTDFIWGATDEDFFKGAGSYIRNLQAGGRPWFLSLLTVGTHQPFDATDEMITRYGSRKSASVALLDQAVGRFIDDLKKDRVLNDTLVIITADESHGAEGADWYNSWVFSAVLAPEQEHLPRLKKGTYGLVDIEVSVLDYLGLPLPPDIIGRSFFRDYPDHRDMMSYTAGKLRRQTSDNTLFECTRDGDCRMSRNTGILGGARPGAEPAEAGTGDRLFAMAAALDNKLTMTDPRMVLQFAKGETRNLPEKIDNEWTDNLIGAQYLSFPENSHVYVDIHLRVVTAGPEGIQPKLTLRQFEQEVTSIDYPSFPLLMQGEDSQIRFDFENPAARNAFSFHLTAAGKNASLCFEKFEVAIERSRR